MHLPNTATSLALSLALMSCGKDQGNRDANQAESRDVSELPADSGGGAAANGGGAAASTIHVVIGGGPRAGTYDLKDSEHTCSSGSLADRRAWGFDYSVRGKKPNELSSLGLTVPYTDGAADSTGKFVLTVGFGDVDEDTYSDHSINTLSTKRGSGTVTVEDRGQSGKVTFKGKTADGVALEGTIECHQVTRGL
jgi:hypothetical protein